MLCVLRVNCLIAMDIVLFIMHWRYFINLVVYEVIS